MTNHFPTKRDTGFSLLELMVVVAIIGILASIAIPNYNDYIRRSKLTDGTAILAQYRIDLEQYYQDNRNYGVASAACTRAAPSSTTFTYSCVVGAAPADTFTAKAESKAGQGLGSAAGDYTYTITESNVRSTTKFGSSVVSKSCWTIKGTEC